ncbi:MAG: SUMF1/EgtB/PvdO family nonheme iron enzyme [Phycisphaerales bacterium JB059]
MLRERTDRAAEEILSHLAWNGTAYEIGADFESVRAGVIERERAWRARLAELVRDHATIEGLLDDGWQLDEATPEGAVRALALRWRESEELADPRLREGLSGVLDRVSRLEAIEGETETDRLVDVINAGGEAPVGVLAAYLGLDRADPAWPGPVAPLEAERRAMGRVIEAAEGLASGERSEQVGDRVRSIAQERWARFANAAGTLGEVDAAAESREAFGAGLEMLRPRPAYNVALREFMLGVSLDMDEEALRQRVAAFRDRLTPLRQGVGDTRAERLIDEITQIAMPPDDSRPVLEASMFGPGRHGWSSTDIDGGEQLVYTTNHRGQPLRIEFVRIEPDSVNGLSRAAYVSRREVSLGVALAMCDAVGDWETLGDAWLALDDARQTASEPGGQRWDGARVWRWDPSLDRGRGALTVNDAWLMRHPQITPEQPAYPPGIGDPQDPLRIDASQGPPGFSMPMNHVSPRAAEALASARGARLPTEQEWRAALARGGATPNANRRDATFARQRDWVRRVERELTATGAVSQFSYPDRGAYQPRSVSTPTDGAATTLPTDDGVLWLAPVDAPGAMFSHLVGNVAEIVRQGERFAVIGASALSAPEVDPETAYTARNAYARRGFNDDVGFRLALDVPDGVFRQTVNRRLEKLLARAECVFEP